MWCKIWRKTDLWFGKWHEEFGRFSSEYLKVSKLVFWWDHFVQSRKCISYNLQRSYNWWHWRMMKNLKRNWLVVSKLTWGIWRILTRALENLKNLHFNGLLLTKVNNVWAKRKYREVMFDGIECWYNIWRKTGLYFSKMTWGIQQIFTRACSEV